MRQWLCPVPCRLPEPEEEPGDAEAELKARIEQELAAFFAEPCLKPSQDALAWWAEMRHRSPLIALGGAPGARHPGQQRPLRARVLSRRRHLHRSPCAHEGRAPREAVIHRTTGTWSRKLGVKERENVADIAAAAMAVAQGVLGPVNGEE